MEELKLKVPREGVLEETDNDKVMDFISYLPKDVRMLIYTHIDETPGDVNISFCVDDMHCFIHKFAKEGDSGLVYALSFNREELCFFIKKKFDEDMAGTIIEEIMTNEGNIQTEEESNRKNGLREASKKEN